MNETTIIISRTDSIGDSILTLPLCGYLKKVIPDCRIVYLGKAYTRSVVSASEHVDDFIEFDESKSTRVLGDELKRVNADVIIHVFPRKEVAIAARLIRIPIRIGTTGRFYHVYNCNVLIRFSRKRSELHESQLNFKLLKGLGITYIPGLDEIPALYGLDRRKSPTESGKMILHPGSRGSAVDWSVDNFAELAQKLVKADKTVYITGSQQEGDSIRDRFSFNNRLVDMTGKLSLSELIDFISSAEALVACSTGPLHIAAALDVHAVGLYVDIKPIHPGRWAPVGKKVTVVTPVNDHINSDINTITPETVFKRLE